MSRQLGLFGEMKLVVGGLADNEGLNKLETLAMEAFARKLVLREHKTRLPIAIAMMGLTGSGKSTVAPEIAERIGAVLIDYDNISLELRSRGASYEGADEIALAVASALLSGDHSVVLDSDFASPHRRGNLRKGIREAGFRLDFVRTYADVGTIIARLMRAGYHEASGGADVIPIRHQEGVGSKNAVVKIEEMWRRTGAHYQRVDGAEGRWVIKNPPCQLLADIDTTRFNVLRREVKNFTDRLLEP